MGTESDEHKHWNCPPVRPPRRNDLLDDPEQADVITDEHYKQYSDEYFEKYGVDYKPSKIEDYTGGPHFDNEFVKKHEAPVGQIRWNEEIDDVDGISADLTKYAGLHESSGTLIDKKLFLTAGHTFVLDGGPPPAHVASQMHVTFDYQYHPEGELHEGESYNVVELKELVFRHAGLDYAILRLDGEPGTDYEKAEVAWGDARVGDSDEPADPLCIIGHPNGLPKRVVTGTVKHLHDVRIGYDDINTAPGSSGAGILSEKERLVGVHSASGIGINKGHNHGIRISAILSVSPTLREIVEGPYKYESHSAIYDSSRSTLHPYVSGTKSSEKQTK